MNTTIRFLVGAMVAGVIAGVTGFGLYYYLGPGAGESDLASQQLPADMKFTDLAGKTHTLEEWRGRLLLINFWATWCGPCRKEIPDLVKAQKTYGSRGFQIIGPAVDDPTAVRQEKDLLGIDYPIMTGTPETMISLMGHLGNRPGGLPFSVLVGADGHVIERHLGAFDPKDLNTLIVENLPR